MALQVDVKETDIGTPILGAYARMEGNNGNYTQAGYPQIITVWFYVNKAAAVARNRPIAVRSYPLDVDAVQLSGPLRAAIYGWLKLHPDFAGAVDA